MPGNKRVTILETPESLRIWHDRELRYIFHNIGPGRMLGYILAYDSLLLEDLIADLREEGRFADTQESNGTESA